MAEKEKNNKVMRKVKRMLKNFIPICGRSSTKEDDRSEGTRDVNSRGIPQDENNSRGIPQDVNSRSVPRDVDSNINSKASARDVETKNYQENRSQNLNNAQSAINIPAENGMDGTQIIEIGGFKDTEARENPGKSTSEELDSIIETVNNHIQQATTNTQLACSTLRSLYTINASSVREFIDFRRGVTKYARIYSDEVFPLASKVISYIQDFMENYSTLEFDEFKEVVSNLAEDARQKQDVVLSVKELHVRIGNDLRDEEDRISDLLKSLENEARIYKEKAEGLQKTSSNKALQDSIANEEESKLAISAAFHVKNFLSNPIKNFVVSLIRIAEFFDFFGEELKSLADSSNNKQWDHYSRCREKADLIINSCRSYISAIPDYRSDLAVIPDDYDKNYVKDWLLTKGTQNLSLLDSEKN